jgi:hypothetical protein
MSISLEFRETKSVSSVTCRLEVHCQPDLTLIVSGLDILNYDRSIVGEFFKVHLESQIIVCWLHVGGQHYTTLHIGRARDSVASSDAHSATITDSNSQGFMRVQRNAAEEGQK